MKKLLGIFMVAVTVIAACAGFVGCNKGDAGQGTQEPPQEEEPVGNTQEPPKTEEPAGKLYSLQAAYDEGFITKEDLEQMAYYVNNFEKPEEELDSKIEQAIKNKLAESTRIEYNPSYKFKADSFIITKYYGEYNGCYAFISKVEEEAFPAVEDPVEVAGVMFTYPYPNHIRIYKIDD